MILLTYQSATVLAILKKNEIYRAKPSISYKNEYAALMDMLGITDCQCPVFALVKGRKQNSGGRVSGAVRLTLDVPKDQVRFTEYGVWADFLYAYQFAKAHDYKRLRADCEDMTHRRYTGIIHNLKTPRPLGKYKYPQALIEEIRPEWLVGYKIMPPNTNAIHLVEKVANLFRK